MTMQIMEYYFCIPEAYKNKKKTNKIEDVKKTIEGLAFMAGS